MRLIKSSDETFTFTQSGKMLHKTSSKEHKNSELIPELCLVMTWLRSPTFPRRNPVQRHTSGQHSQNSGFLTLFFVN